MKHLLEQLMTIPEAKELLRRVEDGGCPAAVTGAPGYSRHERQRCLIIDSRQ